MSREIYKGLLLQYRSSTYETTYYDGHRNEGTGRFETTYWFEVVCPTTGKSITFQDKEAARLWIDSREEFERQNQRTREAIERLNDEIQDADSRLHELRCQMRELRAKLNPEMS